MLRAFFAAISLNVNTAYDLLTPSKIVAKMPAKMPVTVTVVVLTLNWLQNQDWLYLCSIMQGMQGYCCQCHCRGHFLQLLA